MNFWVKRIVWADLFSIHSLAGGDGDEVVDVVHGTSTAEVVDGSCYALEDRANGYGSPQTLYKLVADVSYFEVGVNEYVGVSGDVASRSLLLAYGWHECGISL